MLQLNLVYHNHAGTQQDKNSKQSSTIDKLLYNMQCNFVYFMWAYCNSILKFILKLFSLFYLLANFSSYDRENRVLFCFITMEIFAGMAERIWCLNQRYDQEWWNNEK